MGGTQQRKSRRKKEYGELRDLQKRYDRKRRQRQRLQEGDQYYMSKKGMIKMDKKVSDLSQQLKDETELRQHLERDNDRLRREKEAAQKERDANKEGWKTANDQRKAVAKGAAIGWVIAAAEAVGIVISLVI